MRTRLYGRLDQPPRVGPAATPGPPFRHVLGELPERPHSRWERQAIRPEGAVMPVCDDSVTPPT